MISVFYCLLIILAVWLGGSTWIFAGTSALQGGVALGVALLIIIFSFLGIRKKAKFWPAAIILLGVAFIIWAIISKVTGDAGWGIFIDELIVALLCVFLAYLVTQMFVFPNMTAVDRTGDALATMSNIKVKDGSIVVRAVLLGSMPSTIIIYPEEVWKLLPFIETNVITSLPGILYRGWKKAKEQYKDITVQDNSLNTVSDEFS